MGIDSYHCPDCRATVRQMSRALDFFCGHCLASIVVIDGNWAQVQRAQDALPSYVPIAQCRRLTGTEPLVPARGTAPLEVFAS